MIGPNRVIIRGNGREYYVRAGAGELSTDLGTIDLVAAAELASGDTIRTHLEKPFTVFAPRPTDFFSHGKRTGAPMMPKDIGMVIAYTGMSRRDRVLDAGTGSGISAIFFGGIADQVVTCEMREDFSRIAEGNIRDADLANVECRTCDVLEVSDGPFDVVHLDMMITPEHVEHAYRLLRAGGYFATYTPFLEQTFCVIDTARRLFNEDLVQTFECMERELTRSARGTRPSTRVSHTGYLTIVRKI
ncbi:MAG: methyltransferase domain-containing protein [Methanocalculaceae archaeon]|jgi:tRNA (adenine57-N1/adenine58-N1)-methyltransferase|nr:methyltransferase domain-containing protein [Methanocalculaceae archaeon]